jgi:hypothetical protein
VPSAPPVPRLNLPSSDHQALVARSQSPTLQERTRLSKYTSKEDFIAKRARSPRHDNQPSGYYEAVREGNGLDPDNNYSIPGNNSHPEDTLWGYNP